jgi:lipoate-protein ligase A
VTRVNDCRLIVDPPARGAWNMAVDEALLADALDNGIATLRFYQWSEPTLSLGYFQRFEDRHGHTASREAAVVRRHTGGGAILHDHELTYSVALPAVHPLAGHADELYSAIHGAVIEVLQPRISAAAPGWKLQLRHCDERDAPPPGEEPFLCFQRRASGDLLLVAPAQARLPQAERAGGHSGTDEGLKILGSAQRRRHGAILQHGSLLLEKSSAAPELSGISDLTGTRFAVVELAAELTDQLSTVLGQHLRPARLGEDLHTFALECEARKYAALAWTNRR